ncbi:MAG: membrane protein insertase YidC [Acetatifactor sp.]|nr:membrane protein insertase YidC [Acetatifactor sp.]
MKILVNILTWIMSGCYFLVNNYGFAIILFTLLSKIILLPVSVWVQKNSIKMVKMQPEINYMKIRLFGDKDLIAEEQAKIFKREKYNPFASVVPMILQILLLLGVIEVIKAGIGDPEISMDFFGIDLSLVPSEKGGMLIFSPVIAGVSAWLLGVAQNAANVLQMEQSKRSQYGVLIFSVALSLWLGWFVPVGVAVYWTASNLFAIVLLFALNIAINPGKYIDYEKLNDSKQKLSELEGIGKTGKNSFGSVLARRERADYKRFFSVVNKHVVFYSEGSGFYKYYRGIIEYLLSRTNIIIHYITSDPDDNIFQLEKSNSRLKAYYIGEKRLITMMMKMDADIVVMTMPDLDNFHIKRSYVRDDIEYIYIPHGMDSLNLTMRTGSMNHYDTVFCVGKHQKEEIEKTEAVYDLPQKKLVEWGYGLLDDMKESYSAHSSGSKETTILIAPSWQPDNIVDSCLEEILDSLVHRPYQIIVRPHPQHVRQKKVFMNSLKQKYSNRDNIEIQTDFSSNQTVFEADVMITDWSGIAYEYAYTTEKPVLFINTPMKVMNPEYNKIDTVPLNILLREEIGCSLNLDEMGKIPETVDRLIKMQSFYKERIHSFVEEYVYNPGSSAETGAGYIISSLQEKIAKRRK